MDMRLFKSPQVVTQCTNIINKYGGIYRHRYHAHIQVLKAHMHTHTHTQRHTVYSHTHRLLSIEYTDTHAYNKYICNKYTHVHVSKMHRTHMNSDIHVQTHTESHRS